MRRQTPHLQELCYLYDRLSPEERDELLQEILAAAPQGGKAMIEALDQRLLSSAVEELLEEYAG